MKTFFFLIALTTLISACSPSSNSSNSGGSMVSGQGENEDSNDNGISKESIPNDNPEIQIVFPPNNSRLFKESSITMKGRVAYSNGQTASKALLSVTVNGELATINSPEVGLWSASVTPQPGVNHYEVKAAFTDGTSQQRNHQITSLPQIEENVSIFKVAADRWLAVNNKQVLQYNPDNGIYSNLIADLESLSGLNNHVRVLSRDNKTLFLLNRSVTKDTSEETVALVEIDLETLTLKATYSQGDFSGAAFESPKAIDLFCDPSEENAFFVYNSATDQLLKMELSSMTTSITMNSEFFKGLACLDENNYYYSTYIGDSQAPVAYSIERSLNIRIGIYSNFDNDLYNLWVGIGFNEDRTAIYYLAKRKDSSTELIKFDIASREHTVLSRFYEDIPSVSSFIDETEKTMLYSFENSLIKFHYDTLEKEYLITSLTGSGFAFDDSNAFSYDKYSNELNIIGRDPDYIARLKLDTLTRDRLASDSNQYFYGSGLGLEKPAKAFYNPAINAYILGDLASGTLTKIDPDTGERTLFSGALSETKKRGSGECTPLGEEVLFDPVQGYIYAAGDPLATDTYLCEIDSVTGDRRVISSKNMGTGPHITHGKYLSWDGNKKRALIYDEETQSIYWIYGRTGNRELAYEFSLPGSIVDLKMVAEKAVAYAILFETDISKQSFYRIDLTTGRTETLYNKDTYPDAIGTYINAFHTSSVDDVFYVLLQEDDGTDMRKFIAWDIETNQTVQISYTYAN